MTEVRQKILEAVCSTDSQSPFISPTQLADALTAALAEIANMMGLRREREWMNKEQLKRRFSISDHICKRIIAEYNIPTKITARGRKYYSVDKFQKAYTTTTL